MSNVWQQPTGTSGRAGGHHGSVPVKCSYFSSINVWDIRQMEQHSSVEVKLRGVGVWYMKVIVVNVYDR